jgi:hypothetical protein
LILFPFACIKLGYIYAHYDIAYFTSHDRIQRDGIRFFHRIDLIVWILLLLSPLPPARQREPLRRGGRG